MKYFFVLQEKKKKKNGPRLKMSASAERRPNTF